ncbi:hypothetical protein KQI65_04570 [bacterium]|nr:hypothetical protein [bacterium]
MRGLTQAFCFALLAAIVYVSTFTAPLAAQQHWYYDFGTGVDSCTQGVTKQLLPAPPSGDTRVRIGSQGGGVYLRQSGASAIGSGSEMLLRAPTGSSLNKAQLYDFAPGDALTLRCSMRIDGLPGDIYLFAGNGSCFSDNGGFTSAEVFMGVRWSIDTAGTVTMLVRRSSGWTPLPAAQIARGNAFLFELYGNNGNSSRSYVHDSVQTVAAGCCDIWLGGVRVADDISKTGLPDSVLIDSFMWYAAKSTANLLELTVDDVRYLNSIAAQPLPVELQHFRAARKFDAVELQWTTAIELNNHGFYVQRRTGAVSEWENRGFIRGQGCRSSPMQYRWSDTSVSKYAEYAYRLRQQDRDGSCHYSATCVVPSFPEEADRVHCSVFPLPAREAISVEISLPAASTITIRAVTLSGEVLAEHCAGRLLPAGRHVLSLPCSSWPRGMHILEIHGGGIHAAHPMVLR